MKSKSLSRSFRRDTRPRKCRGIAALLPVALLLGVGSAAPIAFAESSDSGYALATDDSQAEKPSLVEIKPGESSPPRLEAASTVPVVTRNDVPAAPSQEAEPQPSDRPNASQSALRVLKIFAVTPEVNQTAGAPLGVRTAERLPAMSGDVAAEEAIEPKPAQPEMIGQPEPRGFRGLSGISGQILPVMSVAATPELQQSAVRPAIEMAKAERLPAIEAVPEPTERPRFAVLAPASPQTSPEPSQPSVVSETPAQRETFSPNEQPALSMASAAPSVASVPKAEPAKEEPRIDVKVDEPSFAQPKQPGPPAASSSFELVQAEAVEEIAVPHRRTLLLRMKSDVQKTTVVDPAICDIVRLSPRELSVVGKAEGATHISVSLDDGSRAPQTYLVRVVADPEIQRRRERHCAAIQEHLHGLYPNGGIQVVPFGSLALLKGEAKNFSEALQILELTEALACQGADPAVPSEVPEHVRPPMASEGGMSQVINMLKIRSVQRRAEATAPQMR